MRIFVIIFLGFVLVSCTPVAAIIPAETATVTPSPTLPSTTPTLHPFTPEIHISPEIIPSNVPLPFIKDNTLYLRDRPLFVGLNKPTIYYWQKIYVTYSPTFKYFMVVISNLDDTSPYFSYLFRLSDGFRTDLKLYGARSFRWSPDEQSILYARNDYRGHDWDTFLPLGPVLLHMETGSQISLPSYTWRWNFPDWSPNGRWLAYMSVECNVYLVDTKTYQVWLLDQIYECSFDEVHKSLTWKKASYTTVLLHYNSTKNSETRSYEITDDIYLSGKVKPVDIIP